MRTLTLSVVLFFAISSPALAERYKPIHKLKVAPTSGPFHSFLCTAGVNPNPPGRLNATIAARSQSEAEGKFTQLVGDANLILATPAHCLDRGTQ